MSPSRRILFALFFGLFLAGLPIILMWGHTSKLIGIGLVAISLLTIYGIYKKKLQIKTRESKTNVKNVALGLFLIFLDLSYNFLNDDALKSFDYGMILSGLFIVLLNSNNLDFLKLDKEVSDFISYFIFVLMILIGFSGTGLTFLNNFIYNSQELPNPLYIAMTDLTLKNSAFVLSLLKPTVLVDNIINFDGYQIGISYPCSGIESLTVFLSAIIAYYIAKREKNIQRIIVTSLIGTVFFYLTNILRVVIIILVGHSLGYEAMNFTHNNLGWILFVISMSLFWYFILEGGHKIAK